MKRTLIKIGKWLSYSLLALLLIAAATYGYAYWNTEQRLNKVYPTQTPAITITNDSAAILRGAHLYVVHACRDCHAPDLRGRVLLDNPLMGRLAARNLTRGKGGLPADFNDQDWLRTLKHGVKRDGKPLLVMPAHETTQIADQELADIIAYCKSQPPVDNQLPPEQLGPMLRAIAGLVEPTFFPAEKINHAILPIARQQPEVSAAYGKYLTIACSACHRENFRGGPPLAPGCPPVPDITAKGRVGKWTEAEFMRTLRTGVTPDGHQLDSTKMPWPRTREFSETELKAVRTFLLSLPEADKTKADKLVVK
jgi:mono/diheme cytochrome c family protein